MKYLGNDVLEKDQKLDANLIKAPKLTNKVLHPGRYKQNVQLALDIFHETTVAAISWYFPNCNGATGFLKFFNTWWTISNPNDQHCFVIILVEQLFKMITNLGFCAK